jgi:hypothetical protein
MATESPGWSGKGTTKVFAQATMDWSLVYPEVKSPPPTSTPGEAMDSFTQQVTEHCDLLKWILNRYKVMDKTCMGLRLSN